MKQIIDFLSSKKKFYNILNDNADISSLNDESLAFYLACRFLQKRELTIVVLDNMLHVQTLFNILSNMLKNDVYTYCVDEVTKFSSIATSPELLAQRIYVLDKIIKNEPIIVLTHVMATKRLVPSKLAFNKASFELKIKDHYQIKSLIERLTLIGYKNVYKVSQPFEFSYRGDVVDVYSINQNVPTRIEFFDDEIESIRFIDIDTSRTSMLTDSVTILPASDFIVNDIDKGIAKIEETLEIEKKRNPNNIRLDEVVREDIEHLKLYDFNEAYFKYYSFFDNYDSFLNLVSDNLVYLVNYDLLMESEKFIETETVDNLIDLNDKGESLQGLYLFNPFNSGLLNNSIRVSTDITNKVVDLDYVKVDTFDFSFDQLYQELINLESNHYTIYIGLESSIHFESLVQYLENKDIGYYVVSDKDKLHEGINISHIDYNIGLNFTNYKLYVIGEKEIFNKRFKNAINQFSKYKNAITINSINELNVGDYLVHESNGIGIYKGLETMVNKGIHRDYIVIEYKGNSKLYLPLEQFKLVRKYVSKEGAVPHLNKLGTNEWEKTKAKIKERVNELAERLVSLYSLRVQNEGYSFNADDEVSEAFENDFGYPLTADQQKVLEEVKEDMEKPIIMDRLLVGDVGFGKTEIAFRAAFKAINSGKQVMLLCPTTLLARQHYLVARDRFRNFGVRIGLFSRMVSNKEIENNIARLKDGSLDFAIGTHRLLSSDVKFKDLGLLIIDEEHKFGVEHKEKIKEMKGIVDVLTLSATPIPRTLQMALTGVRGFSTINTPIENRMPVQTYVIAKDDFAIKEIIERELARNGQVYYLCNKLEKLPALALKFSKEIKNAKVAIAHGKLTVEEIEDTMQDFMDNKYNILLCSTIIENGIDIENVNTIIVEDADCFGLSQLYQIKGRVGRGDRLAYAYLMYKKNKELSEVARKRLQTIKEFASLGSGYKVAMRDLICRGAGDMLGEEQSGFIDSVGIDMYIEMLHQAIERKKNLDIAEELDTKIVANKTLSVDAYIPEDYFNNDYEKIDLYKRIDKANDFNTLQALKDEMIDKTGHLPKSIEMMFEKKRIDLFEGKGVIESYEEHDNYVAIKLNKKFNSYKGVGVDLFETASRQSNAILLRFFNNQIEVQVKKVENFLSIILKYVESLNMIKDKYEGK